jgi:hypothetical protein
MSLLQNPMLIEHILDIFEAALVMVAVVVAFTCPTLVSHAFGKLKIVLLRLAKGPVASLLLLFFLALALRAAILPILPVPIPRIHDEFGYLLSADTFSHGRLTNPPHPMWQHFESFHINQQPTYQSMYPPAQALMLAGCILVAGHPFVGVCMGLALMSAAVCWALRGIVSAGWALFGGMIVLIRYGLYSYWASTYCGGAMAALGGALVFGAVVRLMRHQRIGYSIWLAIGLAIMANSRPFEGLVLAVVAFLVLLVWTVRNKTVSNQIVGLRIILPTALLLSLFGAGMGYYFWRVTGSPFKMPYQVNRETYAVAPYFLFQTPFTHPQHRHVEFKKYYVDFEYGIFQEQQKLGPGIIEQGRKMLRALLFYFGPVFAFPLIMLPWVARDRRFFVVLLVTATCVPVMLVETFWIPHYGAPYTILFVAVIIQCLRHLRVWRPRGRNVGLALVTLIPTIAVALVLIRSIPAVSSLPMPVSFTWYSAVRADRSRVDVSHKLESLPGKHLVIVRYSPEHSVWREWVYNDADIDGSKVVWARDMGSIANERLLQYFNDRHIWLLEPDRGPLEPRPYSSSDRRN